MGAREPVLVKTRVDRFLSSLQRIDVRMISGKPSRNFGTLGNGPVPGDHDIDVPGGLTQPAECHLIGIDLIRAVRVEQRDQDV